MQRPSYSLLTKGIFAVMVALTPAIVSGGLIHFYLHENLFNFIPHVWNDQTGYWNQINTFHHVGFNGGLHTLSEKTAPLEAFRFSVHGPAYASTIGVITWVTGWTNYTPILFNMAFIALSILVFLRLIKADFRQMAVTLALVATSAPILQYIPTSSQESFHQAFVIIFGGCLYYLLFKERKSTKATILMMVIGLFWVCYIRMSWSILFFPLFLLLAERIGFYAVVRAGVLTGILTFMVISLFWLTATPGSHSVMDRLGKVAISPQEGTVELVEFLQANFQAILNEGNVVNVNLYGQIALLLILSCVQLGILYIKNRRRPSDDIIQRATPKAFHLYNLILITIAALFLYLPDGYYRVFATHLLLSQFILISEKQYGLVVLLVVGNLLVMPQFLDTSLKIWQPNFEFNLDELESERDTIEKYVIYNAEADSYWCNTIYVPLEIYDYRTTLFPPGIGITTLLPSGETNAFYLLTRNLTDLVDLKSTSPQLNIQFAGKLPIGDLWYNIDSPCMNIQP